MPPAATAVPPHDPASGPPGRALELEGCVNFRDLGGYRTSDGGTIRWRQLLRADGLHKLTEADRRQLIELGLATVIDLRTVDEAEQRGRFPVDVVPVTYIDLPLFDVLPTTE
jgi:protein-tyrosine phosphatase